MKFQIYSDVHLEFFTMDGKVQENVIGLIPELPVLCDNLALLGDIGYPSHDVFQDFVLLQASRFKRVFLVAGNHEYYKSSLTEVDEVLSTLAASRPNVYFLNRTCVELEDDDGTPLRVLGATLWTNVPEEHEEQISRCVNDYRHIQVTDAAAATDSAELQGRKLTVADTNRLHQEDVAFFAFEIRRAQKDMARVVIFTHHAPTPQNSALEKVDIHKTEDMSFLRYMEYTDLEHLFAPHVLLWAYGHTHYSSRQQINQTLVISNQLGYIHPVMDHFDPNFKLDLVINARPAQVRSHDDYMPCVPAGANVPRHMSKRNQEEYIKAGVLMKVDAKNGSQRRKLGVLAATVGAALIIVTLCLLV